MVIISKQHIIQNIQSLKPIQIEGKAYIKSAVFVGLIERQDNFSILLTKRTEHLFVHAGEICFPGGRIEADDKSSLEAALRETEEETGINQDQITIFGKLTPFITGTGYLIYPHVGFINKDYVANKDPFEVDEIFELPLKLLLHEHNFNQKLMNIQGMRRIIYQLPYKHYNIWGATAGILKELSEVIRQ